MNRIETHNAALLKLYGPIRLTLHGATAPVTDEIFFRDTAHGFLAWALATLFMAAAFSLVAAGAVAGTGVEATVIPEAAEQARKAAASYSFFTSLSFLIGAFIACVAGALGGYHRDEV